MKWLFFFILLLITLSCKSQSFPDTIIAVASDTIACKITLVNNYNVFYDYNPKKKKIVSTHIERSMVSSLILNSGNISVPEQETPPENNLQESSIKKQYGVLCPSEIDVAPKYRKGAFSIYTYLRQRVRIRRNLDREFENRSFHVSYSIGLDSKGDVTSVELLDGHTDRLSFFDDLQTEIQFQLENMGSWIPAKIDGVNSEVEFILPLKYSFEQNSVLFHPVSNRLGDRMNK